MNWVHAALWGVAGGFVIEGLDLYAALRRHHQWPWKVRGPGHYAGIVGYVIGEWVRLLAGGVVAGAAAASGQVSGPLAALVLGLATPVVVEKLTASISLSPNDVNEFEATISPPEGSGPDVLPPPPETGGPNAGHGGRATKRGD